MSHYAKVVDGKVVRVIVAEPEFFHTYNDPVPGAWIQTSYNTRGNVHYGPDGQPDGKPPFRGNYAGIGYVYDSANDVFYEAQPFPSWTLNTKTWTWEAPVPVPAEGHPWYWDESIRNWSQKKP